MEPILAQVVAPTDEEQPQKLRKGFDGGDVEPAKNQEQLRQDLEKRLKERAETSLTNRFDAMQSKRVKPEDPNLKVINEPFEWVLINIANTQNRPRAEKASFRVLGFFESREAAREELTEWMKTHPWIQNDSPIWCVPACKWILLAKTWEQQNDSEYTFKTIDEVLQRYYDSLEAHRVDFEENVKERKIGEASEQLKEKQRQEKKDKRPKHRRMNQEQARAKVLAHIANEKIKTEIRGTGETQRVKNWPNTLEVRGQKVAAISYVIDPTTKEVLVRIYGGFESDEKMQEWKNDAASRVKHFHLDNVDMYEFKSPEGVNTAKIQETFRNEALDKIMNQPKKEDKKLKAFEEWCHDEDAPQPDNVIESSGNVVRNEVAKKSAIDFSHESGDFKIQRNAQGVDEVVSVSATPSVALKKPDIDLHVRRNQEEEPTLGLSTHVGTRRARRAERSQK
jgi:hypothetical protein